jgi:hypothetical protein
VKTNSDRKLEALRKSQNPYTYLDLFGEDAVNIPPPAPVESESESAPSRADRRLSKKDFQEGCRRIFRQYVPPGEGQVLRPQYRDFIARNEIRSPEERSRLLGALSRYDLATSGNFKPHFNREQELLTAAKLLQIEKVALATDASE